MVYADSKTLVARPQWRPITAIVIAGLVARALAMILFEPLAALGRGDDAFYLETARSLWRGEYALNGEATAYRPPGYSAFIALFGASPMAVVAAQCALTIAAAVGVYVLLGTIVPAILIAVCPFFIVYDIGVFSEPLYIALLVLSFVLLYREKLIAGGIFLGAAVITRDTLLLLPVVIALYGWARGPQRLWLSAAIALAIALPWQIYAAGRGDGRMGYNLWVGTWERDPAWMLGGINEATSYPAYAWRNEAEKIKLSEALWAGDDSAFRAVAIDRMADQPIGTAQTWAKRYWRLWIGTRTENATFRAERGSLLWKALKAAFLALNVAILAAGLWAMWAMRRTPMSLFALPVIYAAAIYVPFHNAETRYSLFALPFLLIFLGMRLAIVRFGRPTSAPYPCASQLRASASR